MSKKIRVLIWITVFMTLGSGIVNIFSVTYPALPSHISFVEGIFPLEFINLSRFAVLFFGFVLIITSVNIYKRKKRAFHLAAIISLLSFLFHITKGLDYIEASFSLMLFLVLYLGRKNFTIKSSQPELKRGVMKLLLALIIAIIYGASGFWFLDPREFGINFHFTESVKQTLLFLSFVGNDKLIPKTHYAKWFLDSLYFMGAMTIIYSVWSIYRPVRYIFLTYPDEINRARGIAEKYGRHDIDYFKLWYDKSFFFRENCFISYRVANGTAIVLGDPVGPEEEIRDTVIAFRLHCSENDWRLIFHQTLPDFLDMYAELGFEKIKIGDDAVVDLKQFTLEGGRSREFRNTVNRMERNKITTVYYESPVPDEVLASAKEVSDDWLTINGHRERGFTLGRFDQKYLKNTPIMAAIDSSGKMLAFVNIIRSYRKGEATIDLMRRRSDSPGGITDYLLVKVLLMCKNKGYERFSLGLAPMSGFREGEKVTQSEKALHAFTRQLNFLFSFKGLYSFKAKYATHWEPRYVVLESIMDLPRHAMALRKVAEL